MSQEPNIDLDAVLKLMEEPVLDATQISRYKCYEDINEVLKKRGSVGVKRVERLLAVCVNDLKTDMKYTTSALTVISTILAKVQKGECSPLPNLLPTAEAIVFIIVKASASYKQFHALIVMCFETLLSYSDSTLIGLVTSCTADVLSVIEDYCNSRIYYTVKEMPIKLLNRLLSILPPDKKVTFVKAGLPVWFSRLVPTVMFYNTTNTFLCLGFVEALESLTESLVNIDFADNTQWKTILEFIYDAQKYPAIMKNLLDRGCNYWHRLWIIFIKLLKDQITKVNSSSGSPINAMLPVVESAFKMDTENRCRAFECWNALIDNFSSEQIEAYVNKRMKLLIIPLRSNNAKVEQSALAKFNTWWHLIRRFHSKMDQFTDSVLIPFLQFCFGKPKVSGKAPHNQHIAMQFSGVKSQCVQALVEIVGHVECDGCGALPELEHRLLNTKILVDYWNDWSYCLTTAIRISASIDSELSRKQATCLWKTFTITVSELPDNNIRKDLFNELLRIIEMLLLDNQPSINNLVFNVFIESLFCDDHKIQQLLKTKDEMNGPMYKILSILMSPIANSVYRKDAKVAVKKLKQITNFILNKNLNSPDIIEFLLENLPIKGNGLMLWTALAESVSESSYDMRTVHLCSLLLWPLKFMNFFPDEISALAWYSWYTLYNSLHPKLSKTAIDNEISNILFVRPQEITSSNIYFMIGASLALSKSKLSNNNCVGIEKEAKILVTILKKVDDLKNLERSIPILVDTLVFMLHNVTETVNVLLAEDILSAVKITMKLFMQCLETRSSDVSCVYPNILKKSLNFSAQVNLSFDVNLLINNLLKPVGAMFQIETYSSLKMIIADEIFDFLSLANNESVKENIMPILKSYLSTNNEFDSQLYDKAKSAMKVIECGLPCDTETPNVNKDSSLNNFITPGRCTVVNKTKKKKEASIVNTVVENGEEYVVVKSNWKFNPKKLTENQKEKFKKKREDIPALYQDLSQSQDEFKLTTWKTDSQDTSTTTSSKSNSKTANVDMSFILKNIPSSDVVPKIMENMLVNNASKNVTVETSKKAVDDVFIKKQQQSPAVKETKTPRMALKDRVFRNVRNLIEKSTIQNEDRVIEDFNQTVNDVVTKTPSSVQPKTVSLVNSAPPKVTSERPSRVIKVPRKFEDTEVFTLKKRRRRFQNDSQPEFESTETPVQDNNSQTKLDKEYENDLIPEKLSQDSLLVTNETQAIHCKQLIVKDTLNNIVLDTGENTGDNTKIDLLEEENKIVEKCDPQKDITIIDSSVSTEEQMSDNLNLCSGTNKELLTPQKNKEVDEQKYLVKKKRSRIEKQLLIDTVEGHPFLKVQSDKRVTRKNLSLSPANDVRKRTLTEKSNTDKLSKPKSANKKLNQKVKFSSSSSADSLNSVTALDSQEKSSETSEDLPCSEDFIESSQDSTITTISAKSAKNILKKVPIIRLDRSTNQISIVDTKNVDDKIQNEMKSINSTIEENKDIELTKNKTMLEENTEEVLTENMDTEPIECEGSSSVIIINDDEVPPIVMNTENTYVESDTQEIADADTQPLDIEELVLDKEQKENTDGLFIKNNNNLNQDSVNINSATCVTTMDTEDDVAGTISKTIDISETENSESSYCSPFKDEAQRKKDFLNNTIEISPIKTVSPVRDKTSPSPETSRDYVVIKLTSPVQSNGEPFNEKCDSPEIFTADKVSPDKRDQSPPREGFVVTNTSPSSSLSLKKNRPQVRSGRAAQMLGLCAPDKLQEIMNSERSAECDEPKQGNLSSTPARRNLRVFYNSVGDSSEKEENEKEEIENFLKFKRSVPTADCSPACPILKRKLDDITDEAMISPASKRKRVSFHDPPVSTTVAVQKYIEPGLVRSPQSSAQKRQERLLRSHANIKSPKRLDTVFKLDSVLTKAIESFTEVVTPVTDDTEMSSIEQTPAVEVVKTSELNDTDPICLKLVNCNDPIDNIAGELSSSAMKSLLVKELEGKVETVADLAKMTELEVNRLCIKAPKVKVAKKVLNDYALKNAAKTQNEKFDKVDTTTDVKTTLPEVQKVDVEMQTNEVLFKDIEMQTSKVPLTLVYTQTDTVPISSISIQTDESGSKSTKDIISSCLLDRPDFVEELSKQLEESSIQQIAKKLSYKASLEMLMKKITASNSADVLDQLLRLQSVQNSSKNQIGNLELTFVLNYLCDRFKNNDLILFCSQLLQNIHENPS